MIDRLGVVYDDTSHTYTLDGEKLLGISTIAKVGGAEDTWGVASAWGFRVGYEGAYDVLKEPFMELLYKDELREELKKRGLTPWSTRDRAADRGNWVHDVLEQLAQDGEVKLESESDEVAGHMRAVFQWYLDYRPSFVATEVQVASRVHRFAGRYDIRCVIGRHTSWGGPKLCLVDLKTSKGVYPTTHFPQLEGYELASVEMGFPETDARFVLNTHADGTYEFVRSWATSDDFLAYLGALRSIRRIKDNDPEVVRRREFEEKLIRQLEIAPSSSSALVKKFPEWGTDAKEVGRAFSRLRKQGRVEQEKGIWRLCASPAGAARS